MGIKEGLLSLPESRTISAKFCLPEPTTLSGTFSTTGNTVSVDSITRSSNVATVTVAAGHNLQTGQFVTISGATQVEYNGRVKVIVTSLTVFTYVVDGSPVTPATGTIIFDLGGCNAVGVGTAAGEEFLAGDFIYVYDANEVRQVKAIQDETHWTFFENFTNNQSNQPVKKSDKGLYSGLAVKNQGASDGTVCGSTLISTEGISFFDLNGLAPVCGDATGTEFYVTLQRNLSK